MDSRSFSSKSGASSRLPLEVSALDKLTSRANLKTSMLPNFLQVNRPKIVIKSCSATKAMTPEERSPSPPRSCEENLSVEKKNIYKSFSSLKPDSVSEDNDECDDFIKDVRKESNRVREILRIENFYLSADDVLALVEDTPLSRKLIDACLTVFKKKNSENLTRDESGKKVIIASTGFSWRIFNERKCSDLHAPKYVFAYE